MVYEELNEDKLMKLINQEHTFQFKAKLSFVDIFSAIFIATLPIVPIVAVAIITDIKLSNINLNDSTPLPIDYWFVMAVISLIIYFLVLMLFFTVAVVMIITTLRDYKQILIISPNSVKIKRKEKVEVEFQYDEISKISFKSINPEMDVVQKKIIHGIEYEVFNKRKERAEKEMTILCYTGRNETISTHSWKFKSSLPSHRVIHLIIYCYHRNYMESKVV